MKTLTRDSMIVASRQELIDQILLLQQKVHTQSSRVEELEFELDWMKRQLFGTKAERFIPDEDVSGMVCIGEEVSWYYDMEPASLHVVRTVRPKYARPEHDDVVTAALPALPIEKGNAGAGLITRAQ